MSLARSESPAAASGAERPIDVLIVSVDSTTGWGTSTRELAAAFEAVGARVTVATTGPARRVRTFMLTDLTQALAARRAAQRAVRAHDPAAIVYCSITAALLWPRPGAIWIDAIAAENRPGRHGIWQRPVERRRLRAAPLVLGMSEAALASLAPPRPELVVVPVPVERSGPLGERDIAALTYAGDPEKKRLDRILAAWAQARRPGETLLVAGIDGVPGADGVRCVGRLPREEYRALLRRTRVFIAAPRREDYGTAPLEALADGCRLVTTPAPGAYPALAVARALDPRLVTEDLAGAIRTALDDPRPDYAERAAELLVPFSRAAVGETLLRRVLPTLTSSR